MFLDGENCQDKAKISRGRGSGGLSEDVRRCHEKNSNKTVTTVLKKGNQPHFRAGYIPPRLLRNEEVTLVIFVSLRVG